MSVKSKHSSKKSLCGRKEKKRKLEDSEDDIESSEEELDLTKECHPIGYYLNDRAEMINQMFSVIKGNKLKAMLPPILKDYNVEQLKLQCLDQLLGMSEKRITCILEGEALETSSESEVDESEDNSEEKNGTSGSSSDRSEDPKDDIYANNVNNKHKKRKRNFRSDSKKGNLATTEPEAPEQGKTLLEILELEMRARAIRALLKQSGSEKGSDPAAEEPKAEINGVSETPNNLVVDLTECEDDEPSVSVKKEKADEESIDKKVTSFEQKIQRSKTEKTKNQEELKSKRLQSEFGLRNKLFKKKIYRTKQQKLENEEKGPNTKNEPETEKNDTIAVENIVIKEEPQEILEVCVEDPEEGEISTSEEEYPVEIKQEKEELSTFEELETKIDKDGEKITAIDNGKFISNITVENISINEEEIKNSDNITSKNQSESQETLNQIHPVEETDAGKLQDVNNSSNNSSELKTQENKNESLVNEDSDTVEETSWRDRWLKKDGVLKLVQSSKIYAKVKKRIAQKSQKAKEEFTSSLEFNSDSNSNSKLEMIQGSIEEYEKLVGRHQGQKEGTLERVKKEQKSGSSEPSNEIHESANEEKT